MRRGLFAACLAAACGGTSQPTTTTPPTSAVDAGTPPAITLESFAGEYALAGEVEADTCSGGISLAARHIIIDAYRHDLVADVVDRRYEARVANDALVAEGWFEPSGACRDSRIFERWTLRQDERGGLSGVLESTWSLPPDCAHACTVRIRVRAATRVQPGEA